MTLLLLFLEFFKTGLFTVGGGLASLPFIQSMIERYPDWFGTMTLADIVAVAESTPGPVGVNAATFAGYTAAGVAGALLATVALILPSFIIISLIANVLHKYRNNRMVDSVFSTLRPAVTGLIAAAGYSVFRLSLMRGALSDGFFAAFDWRRMAVFMVLLAATQIKRLKSLHPVLYICIGAAAGLLFAL